MSESTAQPTRRAVMVGGTVLGAAAGLAACGSGGSGGAGTSSSSSTSSSSAGPVTVKAADVPTGGGIVIDGPNVVVTQPKAGEFKAFSAVCTHQGCTVASVADNVIHCPCHGSQFNAETGAVIAGPAPAPLPTEKVTVKGGTITVATRA